MLSPQLTNTMLKRVIETVPFPLILPAGAWGLVHSHLGQLRDRAGGGGVPQGQAMVGGQTPSVNEGLGLQERR